MPTQLDKLYAKGLSYPAAVTEGREIAREACGLCLYRLFMLSPTEYSIYEYKKPGRISGVSRLSLKGVAYIAGPMRGYAKNNFPAFDSARDDLIEAGFFVFNPADLDRAVGYTEDSTEFPPYFIRDAMDRDCNVICKCTHILLLPAWENSVGVRPEGVLGDSLGDLTFLTEHHPTTSPPVYDRVPGEAVGAVIGGRLVARYQKWLKDKALSN